MKRLVYLSVIVTILLGIMAACGPAPTPEVVEKVVEVTRVVEVEKPAEAAEVTIKEHYRVAWIPPDMFNPFWIYNRQGMEEVAAQALAERGVKIDITQLAPIKTFDVGEQVAIFENAVEMKVDGIIVCPIDQNSLIPVTERAKEAGIPVVALSTDIPVDATLTNVGVENVPSAKKTAELVIQKLGNKGNYLILTGIPGNLVSDEREQGYKEALAECPDCEILDIQPAYFNRADGMAAMENMLTKFDQIDAVFVANDEVALGAWEALAAAGREKETIVAGFDGNKDATTFVKEGKLIATLDQDPWRQGADSLKSLIEYWEGKEIERYRTWIGDITDPSNAETKLTRFSEMEKWYKP